MRDRDDAQPSAPGGPSPRSSEPTPAPRGRSRGRPALAEDEVAARVEAYCRRYGLDVATAGALPPFPSGRRETPQHREWLVVYRAVKRLAARRAVAANVKRGSPTRPIRDAEGACAICGSLVSAADGRELRLGRSLLRLDSRCADLAERAREAGPKAVARLVAILWPGRRREA